MATLPTHSGHNPSSTSENMIGQATRLKDDNEMHLKHHGVNVNITSSSILSRVYFRILLKGGGGHKLSTKIKGGGQVQTT